MIRLDAAPQEILALKVTPGSGDTEHPYRPAPPVVGRVDCRFPRVLSRGCGELVNVLNDFFADAVGIGSLSADADEPGANEHLLRTSVSRQPSPTSTPTRPLPEDIAHAGHCRVLSSAIRSEMALTSDSLRRPSQEVNTAAAVDGCRSRTRFAPFQADVDSRPIRLPTAWVKEIERCSSCVISEHRREVQGRSGPFKIDGYWSKGLRARRGRRENHPAATWPSIRAGRAGRGP